jgi:glycosyltransferase involved in cell wall biosynthesis
MKKIAVIGTTRKKYGGRVYEEMVAEVLSSAFRVTHIHTGARKEHAGKYLNAPAVFRRLLKTRIITGFDAAIRGLEAAFVLNAAPTKNIVVIHHLDNSQRGLFLKPVYSLVERRVFRNLRKADAVVVVSGFWEAFLKNLGLRNVVKIPNAFDPEKFRFSDEEIERFRETHRLTRKPIVYIGNCRKDKGVVETFRALDGLEVHLVTSGTRDVRFPATHLDLSYRDYLRLLKASSVVVLMSKYKEGWNRTAHEAMLCKTSVVGSDAGGMRELLESGGQIICRDFRHVRDQVRYCLEHPEIGEKGYPFAARFTRDRFKSAWLELMQILMEDSG